MRLPYELTARKVIFLRSFLGLLDRDPRNVASVDIERDWTWRLRGKFVSGQRSMHSWHAMVEMEE